AAGPRAPPRWRYQATRQESTGQSGKNGGETFLLFCLSSLLLFSSPSSYSGSTPSLPLHDSRFTLHFSRASLDSRWSQGWPCGNSPTSTLLVTRKPYDRLSRSQA